jgi:hypothetical protein
MAGQIIINKNKMQEDDEHCHLCFPSFSFIHHALSIDLAGFWLICHAHGVLAVLSEVKVSSPNPIKLLGLVARISSMS